MTYPTAKFIYVVRADYTHAPTEEAWNRWYAERHIPDLLSVPGWISSRRYRSIGDLPKYLTIHEIENPAVFGSEAHRKVAGWGEWEDHIANFSRGFYELMSSHQPEY